MNNKHLLIAVITTALSAINLIASEESATPKLKTFKEVADKTVKQFCRENDNPLCEELSKLIATADKMGSEEYNLLLEKIRETIITQNNSNNVNTDLPELSEEKTQALAQ